MSRSRQQSLFDLPPEPPPEGVDADPSVAWQAAARADRLAAQVVFNRPLDTAFHYLVPDELRDPEAGKEPGRRVRGAGCE